MSETFQVASIEPNGVVFAARIVAGECHRVPLYPGSDVSAYPPAVQAACANAWTPEIVAAFQLDPR